MFFCIYLFFIHAKNLNFDRRTLGLVKKPHILGVKKWSVNSIRRGYCWFFKKSPWSRRIKYKNLKNRLSMKEILRKTLTFFWERSRMEQQGNLCRNTFLTNFTVFTCVFFFQMLIKCSKKNVSHEWAHGFTSLFIVKGKRFYEWVIGISLWRSFLRKIWTFLLLSPSPSSAPFFTAVLTQTKQLFYFGLNNIKLWKNFTILLLFPNTGK